MDGHHEFEKTGHGDAALSGAMLYAIRCLSGKRSWRGNVRGLFGLIRRSFTIESIGSLTAEGLRFVETLRFDDGEVQTRRWRIFDTREGLGLEGDDVRPIRPGKLSGGVLEIAYEIKLGGFRAFYLDYFKALENGAVDNRGCVKVLGISIMKVRACAAAPKQES